MIKFILILFMYPLCFQTYQNIEENKTRKAEVTYIANEGVLIKAEDKKILIDALFGDKDYGFCDIPQNTTVYKMLKSESPFEKIDLIAATHEHVDHVCPPYVIEHLLNNPAGKYLSSKQSLGVLKEQNNYENVKDRILEITPDNLSYEDTTIAGIGVRVYRLSHGPYFTDDPKTGEKINRHQNVENLGFLFNIGGVKIFHSGDSDENWLEEYKYFRLDKENIDIAFLGNGFIYKSGVKGVELVKNYINPRNIVLMHIHHDEFNEYNEAASKLKGILPDIKIFKKELETKYYSFE